MFLFLSKTLDWLLSPLSWSVLLLAVAALLGRRRPRLAQGLVVASLALLLIFSSLPVANALACKAESGMAITFQPEVRYDAVIVLGGGLDLEATESAGSPQFNEAPERILKGFELLRSGQARHVLISGGDLYNRPGAVVEADVLARLLESWGIEPARLHAEGKSRNTRENALESAKIVEAQGWKKLVLVTSAAHMPRALGCFRAAGMNPDVLPVDYRGFQGSRQGSGMLPRASNLQVSAEILRELVGRVVYRAMGYTSP